MQMNGTVVYRLTGIGTKSECIRPFLYLGQAKFQKIWKKGDDSFTGTSLIEYDGKYVVVSGEVDEYDIFQIETLYENANTNSESKKNQNNNLMEEQS